MLLFKVCCVQFFDKKKTCVSIADVSFSIHSSASATIKRLMHFLKTKVGFLRTCTIALAKASLATHIFLLGYMYQKKQEYTRFSVKIS